MNENVKRIMEAALNHINEEGEYPLDDAGCGMYNLDVDLSHINDEDLESKYDVIIQCYPYGGCDTVWLLVYYDLDEKGNCDHEDFSLEDFDDDIQQQIVDAYIERLG